MEVLRGQRRGGGRPARGPGCSWQRVDRERAGGRPACRRPHYSLWYDITAYIHSPGPLHIGCFTTGVSLGNCIIPAASPTSHFPVIFTVIIIPITLFKIDGCFNICIWFALDFFPSSPLGSLSAVRRWPCMELKKVSLLQKLRPGGRCGWVSWGAPLLQGSRQILTTLGSCQHPPLSSSANGPAGSRRKPSLGLC